MTRNEERMTLEEMIDLLTHEAGELEHVGTPRAHQRIKEYDSIIAALRAGQAMREKIKKAHFINTEEPTAMVTNEDGPELRKAVEAWDAATAAERSTERSE